MARGWESKSVESQQDDARGTPVAKRNWSPEERDRAQRRAMLELALASTQADLAVACRPPPPLTTPVPPVRLFIGNLPYQATEDDLRSHFATVGEPTQIVRPLDR